MQHMKRAFIQVEEALHHLLALRVDTITKPQLKFMQHMKRALVKVQLQSQPLIVMTHPYLFMNNLNAPKVKLSFSCDSDYGKIKLNQFYINNIKLKN